MGRRLSLGASAACPNSALSVPHDSHPPLVLFYSSSSHRNLQCYQSLQKRSDFQTIDMMEETESSAPRTPVWVPILLGLQFLLAIIILGLSAYIIHGKYFNTLGFTIFVVSSWLWRVTKSTMLTYLAVPFDMVRCSVQLRDSLRCVSQAVSHPVCTAGHRCRHVHLLVVWNGSSSSSAGLL